MRTSDSIAQIAEALAKAQGQIDDATKTGVNPHFRSKYADLAAVRAVIREPLAVNDIAVVQMPRTIENMVEVETMLVHKSGEFISESLRLPVGKWDAHGIGSGITYARRYGLMALLGIATDDDDGNAAVERMPAKAPIHNVQKGSILEIEARQAAAKGNDSLSAYWKKLNEEDRGWFSPDFRKELKAAAIAADQKEEAA